MISPPHGTHLWAQRLEDLLASRGPIASSLRVAMGISGVVQGVGFRPFVHHVARECGLTGQVRNGTGGVTIEAQGTREALSRFVSTLSREHPPAAVIEEMTFELMEPASSEHTFEIAPSMESGHVVPSIPPDLAVCRECLAEVRDPAARRYRYPFTNCTRCGPRYSIVEEMPYDRARTSMRSFPRCRDCQEEYEDPRDRRFHAEPIACPACGPALTLLDGDGAPAGEGDAALQSAAAALASGRIVALMGLGGFQLLVDATRTEPVARLRSRKHREEKPFAVLYPGLDELRRDATVSTDEERLLLGPEAPIVLVERRGESRLAAAVAPGSPHIGAMLPATPLHALLLDTVGRPLVCTSGNLSDEPMAITAPEALERLRGIADLLLAHDRAIVRPLDDSVVRMAPSGPQVIRRARGLAPGGIRIAERGPRVLALGAELKGAVALHVDGQVVMSQHLGDLDTLAGERLLARVVEDLLKFHDARPEVIACDLHPDFASTRLAVQLAERFGAPLERVAHHHAHVAAVMAEHDLAAPVLGFAWDGFGLGTDGGAWGGEALLVEGASFSRVAHLRPFRLPGGDRAAREPRRAALGFIVDVLEGEGLDRARAWFTAGELGVLRQMLHRGINSPATTSVGRLFDAVAALAGTRSRTSYEGQAAMEVEHLAERAAHAGAYPLPLLEGTPAIGDTAPMGIALLRDLSDGAASEQLLARFHEALVGFALAVAGRFPGLPVVLGGGCFQNRLLVRRLVEELRARGRDVFVARRVPTNDGGIALGQALVALRRRGLHAAAPLGAP